MGARSRSFPGAEPSHSSISRAVAPGCRAGRTSASLALAGTGLGPRSAPLPLDSRFDVRYQLQSAETFPFPAALTLIFGLFVWGWLVWHLVIYLTVCCLGEGGSSPDASGFGYVFWVFFSARFN